MQTPIPVFRPSYGPAELEAVRQVLESGWAGLGPVTRRFETAFAAYVGVPHAVAVSSCTAALHLAMEVAGVRGGEVIVPSLTFVSTAHAVLHAGGTPIFADVEEETLTLDPQDAGRLAGAQTRAILPVHYGGHPADMEPLRALASGLKIPLVEDAAHACGSSWKGVRAGALGDIGCFSFHAVKNLATGEGGMLTFFDPGLDVRLRRLRWLGIDRSTLDRAEGRSYAWGYAVQELGWKCHMNDIPAAIGLAQLARLDEMNGRRARICALYDDAFAGLDGVHRPVCRPEAISSRHNYVIRVDPSRREGFIESMAGRGVATGVHYQPIHLHPFYRPMARRLPVTERVWRTLVTLPLFPDMTDEQIGRVIDAVKLFARGGRAGRAVRSRHARELIRGPGGGA